MKIARWARCLNLLIHRKTGISSVIKYCCLVVIADYVVHYFFLFYQTLTVFDGCCGDLFVSLRQNTPTKKSAPGASTVLLA